MTRNPFVRAALVAASFMAFVFVVQKVSDQVGGPRDRPAAPSDSHEGHDHEEGGGHASAVAPLEGGAPSKPTETSIAAKPPETSNPDLNYTGEIFHRVEQPYVTIAFLFRKGAQGHTGALQLFRRLAEEGTDRIMIMGHVGVTERPQTGVVEPLKRNFDVIEINGKDSFEIQMPDGRKRQVKFRGFESADYNLEDVEQVVRTELANRQPR